MGYGGSISGGAAATQPAREASLSDAVAQFDPTLKRLEEQRDHLLQILGRVVGPHPTGVNETGVEAPPPSMIAQVNIRGRILARLVDEISEVVRRLDAVL